MNLIGHRDAVGADGGNPGGVDPKYRGIEGRRDASKDGTDRPVICHSTRYRQRNVFGGEGSVGIQQVKAGTGPLHPKQVVERKAGAQFPVNRGMVGDLVDAGHVVIVLDGVPHDLRRHRLWIEA